MKIMKHIAAFIAVFGLLLLAFNVSADPAELHTLFAAAPAIDPAALFGVGMAGTVDMDAVMKALDGIESKMAKYAEKADLESKAGELSTETKNAIDALGLKQKELADEILLIKQKAVATGEKQPEKEAAGTLFIKSDGFKDFSTRIQSGAKSGAFGLEVKNTITNTVGNSFSDRRPGVVGGAFREFTLEMLLNTLPASSDTMQYVRENVFTNSAAEVTEGAGSAESSITTTLVTESIPTVAHWLKISRQLASDNAALAAYIDTRLMYGVNLRVENQIIQGNGTAPNMSGFTKSGNFTAHGYTAAALTALGLSATNRFDVIGKTLGDLAAADYPGSAIVLNPADWWTLRLTKDTQGRYLLGDPGMDIAPMLFGVPVVSSNAVTSDNFLALNLSQSATFYNREAVGIQMSDSDDDNFTKQLVTLLATRRCGLAVERPAAVRYGDLTPA